MPLPKPDPHYARLRVKGGPRLAELQPCLPADGRQYLLGVVGICFHWQLRPSLRDDPLGIPRESRDETVGALRERLLLDRHWCPEILYPG